MHYAYGSFKTNMSSEEKEEIKSEQRQEDIEERMFDIAFRFQGQEYKGWARASGKKNDDGLPASYHVVLNGVFFGNLSYNGEHWETDSQREHNLVQEVGEQVADTTGTN
jgi:hypothetical protein